MVRKKRLDIKYTKHTSRRRNGDYIERSENVPSIRIPPANLPCRWQLKWLRRIWLGITSVSVCEWGEEIKEGREDGGAGRTGKEERGGEKGESVGERGSNRWFHFGSRSKLLKYLELAKICGQLILYQMFYLRAWRKKQLLTYTIMLIKWNYNK